MASESESDLNCIICMEVYEEETHPPRTLRCGHTVCTPCLQALLDRPPGQRSCPECRHAIKITSVNHVAVSYAVLRLARALEQARSGGVQQVTYESCNTHSKPITTRCTSAQRWMCTKCQCHPACTHLISVTDALLEMKSKKVHETELLTEQLSDVKNKLHKRRDELTKQLDHVNKELTRYSQLVGVLEESEARIVQASTPSIYTRAVSNHNNSVKEVRSFLSDQSATNLTNGPIKGWESPVITPATPSPSPPLNTLINLQALREKLRVTQNLYAEHDSYGVKKYSRITLRGSDLCLHALTDKPPPPDASLVSFYSLRDNWKDGHNQQRAFLDIRIDNRVEGRVEILLFLRSVRAESFVDLCLGELGYCYKGLRLNYQDWDGFSKTQMIVGMEYLGEREQGHPATSHHLIHYRDGGQYRRQVFPGLVAGAPSTLPSYMATFRIHMFPAKGDIDNMGFGKVESGLGLLRYACTERERNLQLINDCGLLFPV